MEAYQSFAKVYDILMDNISYEDWGEYLVSLLKKYEISEGLILDLGCGTGNITSFLHEAHYNMIGLDNSWDMLTIAKDKALENNQDILYLSQDMRDFELYGTVKAVVSICDSLNYILDEDELLHVFELVNNYLDPGGIFIFDLNTLYKYENVLGERTFAENREDLSFIWDNYYDIESGINTYDLSIFIKSELNADEGAELFTRFTEEHYQRAYSLEKVKELILKAGLELVEILDAFTCDPPNEHSERIYMIAREKDKQTMNGVN